MNPLRPNEVSNEMIAIIQKQKTVEDGVSALAKCIQFQINNVFTGVILPTPIKDQVNTIFEAIELYKGKIAAVLLVNTPNVHTSAALERPGPEPTPENPTSDSVPIPSKEAVLEGGFIGHEGQLETKTEEVVAPEGGQGEAVRVPA